ncbi:MAG: tannase/feruloyl esterase family alpha/beta hydrolase [Sphingomonas sp.]
MKRYQPAAMALGALALLAPAQTQAGHAEGTVVAPAGDNGRCVAIGRSMQGQWLDKGTRLLSSVFHQAGPGPAAPGPPGMAMSPSQLPAHCEIVGVMNERTGVDGQHYAIRFHLRLPERWNGRFLFQGGGGTNGNLGDAVGMLGSAAEPALVQGFAVLSQDSGHDNVTNSPPDKGGPVAFGLDPQARADYGSASLAPVTLAAKALIRSYYGDKPRYSYFFGCSKGGQEGMMLAQRYPQLYDGIVAASPGFSLPRAAIGESWNTQAFASVVKAEGRPVTPATLAASFSDLDLDLMRKAVLAACDGDDGAVDGMVLDFRRCTSMKVVPKLRALACAGGTKTDACLKPSQIDALIRVHDGARDGKGHQIYPGFPWDSGWSNPGWRIWMTGSADGRIPSLNVAMGAPSLAAVFTTPPVVIGGGLQGGLDYALGFDMDRDASKVDAVAPPFTRSAWEDIAARSSNLDSFRKYGGKLIVPQGVSDPVFSINDTLAWYQEVDGRYEGKASGFVRVFPVPGMNHCSGGPSTDQFDALAAIMAWVEQNKRPDMMDAVAGPMSPWPGRKRPLCPFPEVAHAIKGPDGSEQSFACVAARS